MADRLAAARRTRSGADLVSRRGLRLLALGGCLGAAVSFGGCYPNGYFENLLASTTSALLGVVLTDTVNVVLPAPTTSAT